MALPSARLHARHRISFSGTRTACVLMFLVPTTNLAPSPLTDLPLNSCGNLVIDKTRNYIESLDAWEATEGDCWRRCANEPGVTCGGSMRAAFYERTDPPTPQNPGIAVVEGFHWMGCYADNVPDRNLPYHAQSADDMTPAKCASLCPQSNFIGVEYGRECWCGPSLLYNYKTFNRLCPMACAGDASSLCGGRNYLTLYERNGARAPDAPVGNYDYVGWSVLCATST